MNETRNRIDVLAEALAEDASRRGVPPVVVDEARGAITRRFEGAPHAARARVEAYFWGVVRRRALRGEAPALRQSLVLASFVEELTAAGHAPSHVYEELRRVYGNDVDPRLLESFAPAAHAA